MPSRKTESNLKLFNEEKARKAAEEAQALEWSYSLLRQSPVTFSNKYMPTHSGYLNLSRGLTKSELQEIGRRGDAFFHKIKHLDLSGNQLKTMPDFIQRCKNLEVLDLGNNLLTEMPRFESEMPNLKTLSLKSNLLEYFPDISAEVPNLEQLDLSGNQLTEMSRFESEMPKLEILDLKSNLLEYFPDISAEVPNLEQLDLSGNQLTEMSRFESEMPKLEILDLKSNLLEYFPDISEKVPNLERLDLSGNKLTEIPDISAEMLNLKTLDLRGNQLTAMPIFKSEMPKLEILDLESNRLEGFPDISKLPNLKKVFLGDNSLEKKLEVPTGIRTNMPNLAIYNLKSSEYIAFQSPNGALSLEGKLKGADLKKIEEYDQSFFDQIKSLNLSDNNLSEIPSFVLRRCKNLEKLYCARNKLRKIPTLKMPKLQILDLKSNLLEYFPDISQLPNLKKLDLSNNKTLQWDKKKIEKYDQSFFDQIKSLNLSNNNLSKIPPFVLRPKPAAEDKNENHGKDFGYLISNAFAILWERLNNIFINKANKYTVLEGDGLNKNKPNETTAQDNSSEGKFNLNQEGDEISGNDKSRLIPPGIEKVNQASSMMGVPGMTGANGVPDQVSR